MNKEWKIRKMLNYKSGDLFLTRRSGTLRRAWKIFIIVFLLRLLLLFLPAIGGAEFEVITH